MTTRPELALPGVPETLLSPALLARLPANLAPAPWTARCRAVVWAGRASREALDVLPPSLRSTGRIVSVLGGMVRYADTPVGSYDEVFGIVAVLAGRRPTGTVVFMAVDSEASLVGGRTNWAMPKTLATFDGDPGSTMTARGSEATWQVTARANVIGPKVAHRTMGWARQEFPDGSVGASRLAGTFTMQPALVKVEVESDGPLASWLRPGRHLGAVSPEMTLTLGVPSVS